MIFVMVIYVTLINLTEMSCLFLCLCVLESLTWTNQNDISWR